MISNDINKAQNILKNYMNNVIYLDDLFNMYKNDYESEERNSIDFAGDVFDDSEDAHTSFEESAISEESFANMHISIKEEEIRDNIFDLMQVCRNEKLNLFPYLYDRDFKSNEFIDFSRQFSMIIVDWNLDEDNKEIAIEVLNHYKDDEMLRFIIIHTSEQNTEKITQSLSNTLGNISCIDGNDSIYRINNIFLKISQKKEENTIPKSIDDFTNLLIQTYGYLFVAFFDVAKKFNEQTGQLLTDFMHPFDILVNLQIAYDDDSEQYYSNQLKSLIFNQLQNNVEIDESIIKAMRHHVNECIVDKKENTQLIYDNLKNNVDKLLDATELKVSLQKIVENMSHETFAEIIDVFKEFNRYIFLKNKDKEQNELYQNKISRILKNAGCSDKKIRNKIELIVLIGIFYGEFDIEQSLIDMIKLMKLNVYTPKKNFEKMINGFVKNNKDINYNTMLMNKFSFGDLLINVTNEELLLCVSPACDLFRPQKVEYNIKYLKGRIVEKYINAERHHISILPVNNKLKVICWDFFGEKVLNLNDINDLEYLKQFDRPYKLQDSYINQIVAGYLSYNGRKGVEELFIKKGMTGLADGMTELILGYK